MEEAVHEWRRLRDSAHFRTRRRWHCGPVVRHLLRPLLAGSARANGGGRRSGRLAGWPVCRLVLARHLFLGHCGRVVGGGVGDLARHCRGFQPAGAGGALCDAGSGGASGEPSFRAQCHVGLCPVPVGDRSPGASAAGCLPDVLRRLASLSAVRGPGKLLADLRARPAAGGAELARAAGRAAGGSAVQRGPAPCLHAVDRQAVLDHSSGTGGEEPAPARTAADGIES